jgi:hypothetical protein
VQRHIIDFVKCSTIDDSKFQPGGIYYDKFSTETNWYCPETGNIPYSGFGGTAIWFIPKNSDEFNILDDPSPYMGNSFDVVMMTQGFSMDNFLEDNENGE